MSISLIDEISKGGYQASLMTSFSIDFPFYEDVLLKKMQSRGVNHHVLLADKRMCQQVITQRPPKYAGKQYSLALMEHSKAFHPKVFMLLGKKKGMLVVGSHNVTFSGFGKNLEISNVIKFEKGKNEEHLTLFSDALKAFKTWVLDYGNSINESRNLEAVENTLKLCPWLKKTGKRQPANGLSFLFTSKSTTSLWEQFQPYKPAESKQIIATAPFFDKKLDFTQILLEQSNQSLILGVQPEEVVLSSLVFSLEGLKVVNSNQLTSIEKDSNKYIHAKAIYFEAAENSVFVSGSANLSSTAWLKSQSSANAEAVLVRSGHEAIEVSSSLGIHSLKEAEELNELDNRQQSLNENDIASSKLAILPVGDDDILRIETHSIWKNPIQIVHIDDWQVKHDIGFSNVNEQLLVEYKNIVNYGVITVLSDGVSVLNIIIHKDADIKRCCTTGGEQKIQEALGSLSSEAPDIKLLFNCLEKLSCFNRDARPATTRSTSKRADSEQQGSDRELVVSLESEIKRNPKTGKIRHSQGDISHILDLILYSLNSKPNGSSGAYGEDRFGRNEEDLVGSDDESATELLPTEVIDEQQRVAKLCRQKLKSMVNRLVTLLKNNLVIDTLDSSLSSINATLVVSSILPVLVAANEQRTVNQEKVNEWVIPELCDALLNSIFEYILVEKKTPLDFRDESKNVVFSTDEASQLVSHVIWLMHRLNYTIKPMPSISRRKELAPIRNLQNARILFVFQRLIHDSTIEKTTVELFEQYNDKQALLWLRTLQSEIEKLVYDDVYDFCKGYGVVTSEKAFEGYRFSVFQTGSITSLISTKCESVTDRISTDFLMAYP